MSLAETFNEIIAPLPDDWTDLEFDLRIFDESRYVDAAIVLVTCNAQPYSQARLALAAGRGPPLRPRRRRSRRSHWRSSCSTRAGSTARSPLREVRTGRAEIVQMWGRTESVRQEFKKLRAQ